MRPTSSSILSAILLLASQAMAFNPYVGCLNSDLVPGGGYYLAVDDFSITDGASCANGCAQLSSPRRLYGYSAWYGDAVICQCLTQGTTAAGSGDLPPATAWVPSINTAGQCSIDTAAVHRLNTAWQPATQVCATTLVPVEPATQVTNVPNLAACFSYCQTSTTADRYRFMTFSPLTSGQFSCQCASGIASSTPATCRQTALFVYGRSAVAAASGAYRRSLKDAAKRQLAASKKNVFCPSSLQACNIPGSPDAYECMDTKYELESCGGCIAGEFGASSSANSTAVDCTRLAGVPMGATSCLDGKCVAFACQSGYTLRGGVCSRS